MGRDLRPIVAAGATAVVSTGLLVVAVKYGWLGTDVGRGATFCEASHDGPIRQPANTLSNVGFVAAGLMIAWNSGAEREEGRSLDRRLATVMACLVVLLGPGSAAMHATQSALGGHLDMASMYLVASLAFSYAAMRWWRGRPPLMGAVFAGGMLFCEAVGAIGAAVPVVMNAGNAAFGLLLIGATGLELAIMRRGETHSRRAYAYGSVFTLLVAFAVWNVTQVQLCDPYSWIQGHAIWHLLDAVAAYLLYRYYASEAVTNHSGPRVPARSGGTSKPLEEWTS